MPARPKPNPALRKLKVPDHTDLWRIIPVRSGEPMTALIFRQDWWHLTYRTEQDKQRFKNLWTKDPLAAQHIRDCLYTQAKKIGLGAETAMEAHALAILRSLKKKETPPRGITYKVQFANQSGSHTTYVDALGHLERICKGVVSSGRAG